MLAELFIKFVSQFLMNDNQVYTQVAQLYAEMKGGYAVADATVSLQSILMTFPAHIVAHIFPILLLVLTASCSYRSCFSVGL